MVSIRTIGVSGGIIGFIVGIFGLVVGLLFVEMPVGLSVAAGIVIVATVAVGQLEDGWDQVQRGCNIGAVVSAIGAALAWINYSQTTILGRQIPVQKFGATAFGILALILLLVGAILGRQSL